MSAKLPDLIAELGFELLVRGGFRKQLTLGETMFMFEEAVQRGGGYAGIVLSGVSRANSRSRVAPVTMRIFAAENADSISARRVAG